MFANKPLQQIVDQLFCDVKLISPAHDQPSNLNCSWPKAQCTDTLDHCQGIICLSLCCRSRHCGSRSLKPTEVGPAGWLSLCRSGHCSSCYQSTAVFDRCRNSNSSDGVTVAPRSMSHPCYTRSRRCVGTFCGSRRWRWCRQGTVRRDLRHRGSRRAVRSSWIRTRSGPATDSFRTPTVGQEGSCYLTEWIADREVVWLVRWSIGWTFAVDCDSEGDENMMMMTTWQGICSEPRNCSASRMFVSLSLPYMQYAN